MGTGPIVGIVVTVIAWLLVCVFYTMKHIEVKPLQPLFKSKKEHLSYGESRIYKIPVSYGYVNARSYFYPGLVQAYKNISNVQFGVPFEVNWETDTFILEANGHQCDIMFLLPTSTIYMDPESDHPVYAQVMTGSEYTKFETGLDYTPLDEWKFNGSYTLEEGFMDFAFCIINNNSYPVTVNYTKSVLSARYDQAEAFRECDSSKCVFKNMNSNQYLVISNSKTQKVSINYLVDVGYNALYRYHITVILWVVPVVLVIIVVVSVAVSKACCKKKKNDAFIQDIYACESPKNESDGSFNYSRSNLVNPEEQSVGYVLYCSDEDV